MGDVAPSFVVDVIDAHPLQYPRRGRLLPLSTDMTPLLGFYRVFRSCASCFGNNVCRLKLSSSRAAQALQTEENYEWVMMILMMMQMILLLMTMMVMTMMCVGDEFPTIAG